MQSQPEHDDKPEPAGRKLRAVIVAAAVAAVLVLLVVLHLIGALGPNSHQ